MALIIEVLYGGLLDGPVHALDLAVGPRTPSLCRAVFDVVPDAGVFKDMGAEDLTIGDRLLDQWHG